MKLRPALMLASGPPGVWLLDEDERSRFIISIHSTESNAANPNQLKNIAALIADCLPEDIEL